MNLRPIKDQVIVKWDAPIEKIGSIWIPETVNADNPNFYPMTSTVVAVGPGRFEDGARVVPDVEVGDRVVHNRYAGKQVTCDDDGVLYIVMREPDILAKSKELGTGLPGYMPASDEGVRNYKRDPFAEL